MSGLPEDRSCILTPTADLTLKMSSMNKGYESHSGPETGQMASHFMTIGQLHNAGVAGKLNYN